MWKEKDEKKKNVWNFCLLLYIYNEYEAQEPDRTVCYYRNDC